MGKTHLQKVVVGMSGGVDSSMAMYLLKKQGYEPIGVSLKYEVWDDPTNTLKENVCCSDESFEIAKHICEKLGAKHYIINVGKKFNKEIVEYFKKELKAKRTPNPCVICNRVLKFTELLDFAKKQKAKYIATGHYAQIKKDGLYKSKDAHKDQTYSLSFLKKEWLKKILFPLGKYTKDEVYKMAKEAGFGFYLYRKQSQDFCYVSDKSMKSFLEKEIGIEPGPIVDAASVCHSRVGGNLKNNKQPHVLGKHNGLHFYTIGQRKGIEIPNGPYYVIGMDAKKNTLIVGKEDLDDHLYKQEVQLSPYNLFIDSPKKEIKVEAKIRYAQISAKATLLPITRCHSRAGGLAPGGGNLKDSLILKFSSPQRAITLGQYAVFYKGNRCLGSGRIIKIK